jgi:hypothetical protein
MRKGSSVLLFKGDKYLDKEIQILESPNLYIVLYKGVPFNWRIISIDSYGELTFKYKRNSFSNMGSANWRCRYLNTYFSCNDFTVHVVRG